VVIPGTEGEMTVMANHAPVMTTIKPGVVTVKPTSGADQRYVVFGGFADILPAGCTLLAEEAVEVKDIDREDLARRIQDAKEDVADAKSDLERSKAQEFLDHLTTLQTAIAA
jgi:F-type H+-transporting ATPase subunit epsilon